MRVKPEIGFTRSKRMSLRLFFKFQTIVDRSSFVYVCVFFQDTGRLLFMFVFSSMIHMC